MNHLNFFFVTTLYTELTFYFKENYEFNILRAVVGQNMSRKEGTNVINSITCKPFKFFFLHEILKQYVLELYKFFLFQTFCCI